MDLVVNQPKFNTGEVHIGQAIRVTYSQSSSKHSVCGLIVGVKEGLIHYIVVDESVISDPHTSIEDRVPALVKTLPINAVITNRLAVELLDQASSSHKEDVSHLPRKAVVRDGNHKRNGQEGKLCWTDGNTSKVLFDDGEEEWYLNAQLDFHSVFNSREDYLEYALTNLLNMYVNGVNSGDWGNWDPKEDKEVIDARNALAYKSTSN